MSPLGTALTASATRVLVLGSGELGKEVVIALQRLGVETIAADRYDGAPGQQVAHRARTLDMTDGEALRDLVLAERPDVVIPEIEAIATPALEELEAEGTVRVVPTARAARLTMDREGIRRLASETLGLPTSPYAFCDSVEALRAAVDGPDGIGYPCVVKPVMSSSGKGQSTVAGPDRLAAAWDRAQHSGRVHGTRVIVEGFVDFEYEITLLTARAAGADGTIGTSFCAPIGHLQEDGDYVESWQPHAMSAGARRRAEDVARTVTESLGGLGVFGVELFVRGEDVWFSEVSPRPHDTGLVTMTTQWQSEFELHARAVLGLPVDTAMRTPGASAVVRGVGPGTAVAFHGVAAALAVPGTDVRLFGKSESRPRRRLGVVTARADDVPEARARARRAASLIRPRVGQDRLRMM